MQQTNIGIVSLGLIGGSLLKRLSKDYCDIVVVTRNAESIKNAKKYTKNASDDFLTLKNCDIIFVCSPMNKTLDILDKLDNIVKKDAIVADVCSLKEFVLQKERPYVFIGSHPMAGTENSGFSASFETLFEGAKWVLTPSEKANELHINILKEIIDKTGAKSLVMDAKSHDKAVALISHMPLLLSQALMKAAMSNDSALLLAASGFRDMTRLAMSNPEMADDMLKMNAKNIEDSLNLVIEEANLLKKENYLQKIGEIKEFRAKMYDENGKNIYN